MPKIELIQGDCLDRMHDIPDGSIDMILCDLPYGTTACKWDTIIPFEPLWEQYKRIIKDNGAIVLTASQPFTSALVMSNPKMFKYEWIWNKLYGTNIFEANVRPMKYHENICVFYKTQPVYNKQLFLAKKENIRDRIKNNKKEVLNTIYGNQKAYTTKNNDDSKRNPISILEYSNQANELHRTKRLHPTQKPVALFEYLIKTYTNEGDTVMDNCMGSGTTGVACKNLNRNFIGIELDQEYFKIAKKRINEGHKGNEKLREGING